jgi:phenylalanyl-tRNA synthetase beta chain
MKASLNWLKEFVDFSLSPHEVSHLLTMAGLEVEEVKSIEGDSLFEISVTPNRADCLSIRGIAREISVGLGLPMKSMAVKLDGEGEGPRIDVQDVGLCPRYASRIIKGVQPEPSPAWLSTRLESHGIRSTNNVVDITNYVMIETGQPLHAFDLNRLAGRRIEVRTAGSAGEFESLDNKIRSLNREALLIWDAEKPVAIAGVMGGVNSEVTSSTTDVLLESACFDPVSVRRTAKALNLSTESSYRFERGTDIIGLKDALDRTAGLIKEIAGGRVSGVTDLYEARHIPIDISVHPEKIRSLLGVTVKESVVLKILEGLGCAVRREGGLIFVTPPSFRQDIRRDVDVIEEIARIYGYDKIPATLPAIQMQPVRDTQERIVVNSVKEIMVRSGFSEAINLSFMNPSVLDAMEIPTDDRRRNAVIVQNPLKKDMSALRTTLLPALLENIRLNRNRGERSMRLFETARVFFSSGQKLPEEVVQLAAVISSDSDESLWHKRYDMFYDMKGALENIQVGLRTEKYTFSVEKPPPEPYLHPGKSCGVALRGERIGSLGAIHPRIAGALDLPENIIILEISDLNELTHSLPGEIKYKPLPRYPYVERDIALVVSRDVTVDQAKEAILSVRSDIIESVSLFDIYLGKSVGANRKSLAFAIRYRDRNKTLTDSEVEEVHSKIIAELERSLDARLRS